MALLEHSHRLVRNKHSLFCRVKALSALPPHTCKDQGCGMLESGWSLQREEPLLTSGGARYSEKCPKKWQKIQLWQHLLSALTGWCSLLLPGCAGFVSYWSRAVVLACWAALVMSFLPLFPPGSPEQSSVWVGTKPLHNGAYSWGGMIQTKLFNSLIVFDVT